MQAVGGVLILSQCKYMKQTQDSQQEYLSSLNPQQLDAVLCPSDIVFVSAGPGTGKTHLLTSKLVHSIQSSSSHQSIVALSYTNTAARQLGSRLKSKLAECGVTKDYNIYSLQQRLKTISLQNCFHPLFAILVILVRHSHLTKIVHYMILKHDYNFHNNVSLLGFLMVCHQILVVEFVLCQQQVLHE